MTHIIHKNGTKEYLLVAVPSLSYNFEVYFIMNYWHVNCDLNEFESQSFVFLFKDFGGRKKYPKQLSLIGCADQLTEEQAEEIVHNIPYTRFTRYRNYESDSAFADAFDALNEAKNSLNSLLRTHNLKAETSLIIKKQ